MENHCRIRHIVLVISLLCTHSSKTAPTLDHSVQSQSPGSKWDSQIYSSITFSFSIALHIGTQLLWVASTFLSDTSQHERCQEETGLKQQEAYQARSHSFPPGDKRGHDTVTCPGAVWHSPTLQNSPESFYLPCSQPSTEQPSQEK